MFGHWRTLLKQHYSAPLQATFQQFKLGSMLFFAGGVLLYMALQLTPSVRQELVVLAGLLIGGSGFLIAMLAQVRMIISRLWWFFKDD